MNGTFEYVRADDVAAAVALVSGDSEAQYLAGGTTQIDLILKDRVLNPERLVDITLLPLRGITLRGDALVVGALTTMEELAADPVLDGRAAFVREALLAGASTQLRNMATIGGNLLQRTRCRTSAIRRCPRATSEHPEAVRSHYRSGANACDLGASAHCIALHASDLCVPLVALDAVVHAQGTDGQRTIPLTEFYRLPGDRPDLENVLAHGELIPAIEIPLLPAGARSGYLKVRDRASYEFALTSAAVALLIEDGVMTEARVALGGVGTIPWRAAAAEEVLIGAAPGTAVFREAAEATIVDPFIVPGTAFKVELAKRTIVRTLETVAG